MRWCCRISLFSYFWFVEIISSLCHKPCSPIQLALYRSTVTCLICLQNGIDGERNLSESTQSCFRLEGTDNFVRNKLIEPQSVGNDINILPTVHSTEALPCTVSQATLAQGKKKRRMRFTSSLETLLSKFAKSHSRNVMDHGK